MDRFYLAENPRTNAGVAIIHMIEPITIILVLDGFTNGNSYYKHFTFINSYGFAEEYTLAIHHYFTTDFNEENHESKAFKIINKAWHWYKSYLEWEDGNIDNNEFSKLN